MTRKNVISTVFQNSKSKTCSCSKDYKTRDAPGASPRHYGAPVAMALYTQGSDNPVLPMNRRCPRPKKGAGLAQGGGGCSIQQEISRQNMTLPTLYYLRKNVWSGQWQFRTGNNERHKNPEPVSFQ
jgi:hypothetical protein